MKTEGQELLEHVELLQINSTSPHQFTKDILALIHQRELEARIEILAKLPLYTTGSGVEVYGYERIFRDGLIEQLSKQKGKQQ